MKRKRFLELYEVDTENVIVDIDLCGCYFGEGISFYGSTINADFYFSYNDFGKNSSIDFRHTRFIGKIFYIEGANKSLQHTSIITGKLLEKLYIPLDIKLDGSLFSCPAIFKVGLQKCPDFSNATFLSSLYIEEKWPKIIKSEIRHSDENKFRFLKNYFHKDGNSLKEREYLLYEMIAIEKKLIENIKNSLLRGKFYNFIQNYFILLISKIYGYSSNYGNSVFKPLLFLLASCFLYKIDSSIVWIDYMPYYYSSNISWIKSILKTILPTVDLISGKHNFDYERLTEITRSIINSILIFLLLLGIRNRFKI